MLHDAVRAWAFGGPTALPLLVEQGVDTVVLVEGHSDAIALEVAAARVAASLAGVLIQPLGGVTNARRFAATLDSFRLLGLCDAPDQRYFHESLKVVFTCDPDLEFELIAALGHERMLALLDEIGDLATFRTFQNQPFQRSRPLSDQLHRFIGTTAGRKASYARMLVESCEVARLPRPLVDVLNAVRRPGHGSGTDTVRVR